jgi:DNA helicase-2/ATP-dependent DNA helicase PcrA
MVREAGMEDVALATDLDKDTSDEDRVAYDYSFIKVKFLMLLLVVEEDLFPSAMSMSTRSELEEERRLFYVGVKQSVFDLCTIYRWGN